MKFNIESTTLCHRIETIAQMLENAISMEDMIGIEFIEKAVGDMCLQQAVPELYQKMVEAKRKAAEGLRLKAGETITQQLFFLDNSTYLNRGKMMSVMAANSNVSAAAQGQDMPEPITQLAHATVEDAKKVEKENHYCLLAYAGVLTQEWDVQKRISFIKLVELMHQFHGTQFTLSRMKEMMQAS